MKPLPPLEHDEQDEAMIKLLRDLGSLEAKYPAELLTARRAAFLAQVEQLSPLELGEELSAEDQEVVRLLGNLRSAPVEYPSELLMARRSVFLHQVEQVRRGSVWDRFRASMQEVFQPKTTSPILPQAGLRRTSLVIASILAALWIGSLYFSRTEQSFQPSPSLAVAALTHLPPTTGDVALTICKPEDQTPLCAPGDLTPSQDLADPGNGRARPAVSKDTRSDQDAAYKAAYVNDGRRGASWVSNSPDSWIKIDLGEVRTINTVSLQKGSPDSSSGHHPGQFVIAVALSDVYADGDSSDDFKEYAQVFHSEQTGFSGSVSEAETIKTQFPSVQARFVKITFEKAGAAIEEIGVFMVEPPVVAEPATRTPQGDPSGLTSTPISTSTGLGIATSVSTGTRLPTNTAVAILTNSARPSDTPTARPTNTQASANTPALLPTITRTAVEPSTPIPTDPLPSETPMPSPTMVPPTLAPPTAILPTIPSTPVSADPIVVTGNDQTLTFTCNGNDVEIRGHTNTVTLLGSCSSITVTGNGNRVFWQFGSPVITDRGKDNIIQQL